MKLKGGALGGIFADFSGIFTAEFHGSAEMIRAAVDRVHQALMWIASV
jgi:hypothetical protein